MAIQWFPGHMAKTSRLIRETIKVIDLAIIIVDSRCPYSSFSPMIEELFKNKLCLVIFSKSDLSDKNQTNKWKKYYNDKGLMVVELNLLADDVRKHVTKNVEILLAEKFAKEAAKGMKKRRMKLIIAGIPNSGKSTLINRFSKKKVVNVGDRAGVTKHLQWIRVNEDYDLLDSPGVLWPKFEVEHVGFALATTNAIKNEILPTDEVCIFILKYLLQYYPKELFRVYGVDNVDDVVETYEKIGRKLGVLRSGNEVDYERVSERILNDAQAGKFGYVTWDNYELLREFL